LKPPPQQACAPHLAVAAGRERRRRQLQRRAPQLVHAAGAPQLQQQLLRDRQRAGDSPGVGARREGGRRRDGRGRDWPCRRVAALAGRPRSRRLGGRHMPRRCGQLRQLRRGAAREAQVCKQPLQRAQVEQPRLAAGPAQLELDARHAVAKALAAGQHEAGVRCLQPRQQRRGRARPPGHVGGAAGRGVTGLQRCRLQHLLARAEQPRVHRRSRPAAAAAAAPAAAAAAAAAAPLPAPLPPAGGCARRRAAAPRAQLGQHVGVQVRWDGARPGRRRGSLGAAEHVGQHGHEKVEQDEHKQRLAAVHDEHRQHARG
jgi:hypothetical protein